MKKLFTIMVVIFLLFCGGVFYVYQSLWGPGINNDQNHELFIPKGSSYDFVYSQLVNQNLLKSPFFFNLLAKRMGYQKEEVKSGRYLISPNMSLRALLSKLRSGNQDAIDITFNNIRTLDELAGNVARQIEPDSLELLNVLRSEQILNEKGLTLESASAIFIPNTYQVYWDMTAQEFVDRMQKEYEAFWKANDRDAKAKDLGLTHIEISTMASIVQKESNLRSEQPIVAGVYLNRIKKGMPLQADPTVVFAIGDFTIQRVLFKHLKYKSPYNTYLNIGLPPGPICLPESTTIDAVLNADYRYLYFCAKPGYDGGHLFAKDLVAHNQNARTYHRWLNREGILR